MAGISSSIQLADRMTPVLQSITSAMNMMVSGLSTAQSAVDTGFNPAQAVAMQQAVAGASAQLAQYQEELERVQNTPVAPPEPPEWNSVTSQPVFMTSGAERFESEYQAASEAAQQLYKNQQSISALADHMKVMPPGMINDVAATENRMQSLSNRVQKLNSIPVNLRTDQTNNELEALRGKLSQAVEIQEQLSSAMGKMDISTANAAYQQLNSLMDSTERDIRNNFSAQEQFNQSVKSGQTAAGGLEGSIKRYAAMLLSAATAGKAISLADQVTQTSARLDLMNQQFGETGDLQQAIYTSAQRSRGAYQTTADAVAKLGMQARGAFKNTQEVVAFAEQLNKTFVVAGTSAQGVDSVMLQLTQSMASGKLQGEELNAVLDNAQPIVQNIADYMGVPVGEIKKLASEGAISAEIIKNAMFAAAEETDKKFQDMPLTFSQVANSIKNQALMAFQPALQQLSAITQTEDFNNLVSGVLSGIQMLASGAVQALELMGQAITFVKDNWSWLGPVIAGVTTAVLLFKTAILISSVAQAVYNAVLLACPLVWIALVIGLLIAALYAGVAAWNRFTGASISATGIIGGIIGTLVANMANKFIFIWNQIAAFINFFANVFNDPVAAVQMLFYDLALNVISYVANMAQAIEDVINKIPGVKVSITSGLDNLKDQITAKAEKVKNESEWKEVVSAKDFIDFGTAFNTGYSAGQKLENSVKNAFKGSNGGGGAGGYTPEAVPLEEIAGNTGNTAGNTAAMADSMDVLDEDLKYMRDAAEQEIINRFTLAELKVDVKNNNTLTQKADFDDMGSFLSTFTSEFLASNAEGGHL